MAVVSTVADDFDGSTPAETVTFSVGGRDYEIDLSETNRAELEQVLTEFEEKLSKFTEVARPVGKQRAASSVDASKVRLWAVDNGFSVKDRGRIPAEVLEAYRNRGRGKKA